MSANMEPVAIIGSACRFPGDADSPSKLWDLLRSPRPLGQRIPSERFSADGFYHPNSQFPGHSNVREAYFLSGSGTHRKFDAPFFGMSPAEAMNMDPQVRHLLEAVYEALEASGLTLEGLTGSDTAVYTGQMVADYDHIITRDLDHSLGIYHASGTAHAMLSNRISYFYDWHGPSMTMDTACSSSLVALHHAVQQVRSGLSRVAVATGANLILDPKCFISLSSLNMLSPDGQSRMWDASANGYARGEGIAAVIIKTLSAALADGDHIECVIRETGFNQDGRSQGITSPSAAAQIQLIRDCYTRSGLDLTSPADRPQFFECHGTGTMAGDAAEAEAISTAFFPTGMSNSSKSEKLFVGSIKSIMGHTEGTAGLAGILKASLALQNATIPPNLLFNRLNPRIEPFYSNLEVATKTVPWPDVMPGQPRRASVNSFGFGGANVHAILESYTPRLLDNAPGLTASTPVFTPFVFSAASEPALTAYLQHFRDYLKSNPDVPLREIAYTLHSRRSGLQVTASITASSVEDLVVQLDAKLEIAGKKDSNDPAFTRLSRHKTQTPGSSNIQILGVFTGQGAQHARMGAELILSSTAARDILDRLESRLQQLPEAHRPTWSLTEEILKDGSSSRLGEATLSQPLCTAVQILQVELLRAAGVDFAAVVGHSSGEIAAAYAAGFISAEDAICIAYYRGFVSHMARPGAMMAVGTSVEDAQELCDEPEFKGRVTIAAINSPVSLTIAGDEDAVQEMKVIFEDEKKFARLLKVDKAYHSPHMAGCSEPYLAALAELDIKVTAGDRSSWYSSVFEGDDMKSRVSLLRGPYFDSNMLQPVLFQRAVSSALDAKGPFDLAIEVGPHPALKGPVLQTVQEVSSRNLLYTGLLYRGRSAISSVADGLGYIWSHFGKDAVSLLNYDHFLSSDAPTTLVKGLPKYSWDHQEYWNESRHAKAVRTRPYTPHELLGHMTPDSHEQEMRWRHILRPIDIPWLLGHRLQDQIVFPGAGYVVTALEAALALCKHRGLSATLIEFSDAEFGRALVFDLDDSDIEIFVSLSDVVLRKEVGVIEADFKYYAADHKADSNLNLVANGRVKIQIGEERDDVLPTRPSQRAPNLIKVNPENFYSASRDLHYHWAGTFVALDKLQRKNGVAAGVLNVVEPSHLVIHPAVLDAAFQGVLLAYSFPGDGQMWTTHVPGKIHRVTVNPSLCRREVAKGNPLPFDASHEPDTEIMVGDTEIYPSEGSDHAILRVEGVMCVPLSRAAAHDDKEVFASVVWDVAAPDARMVSQPELDSLNQDHADLATELEQVARYYLGRLDREIPLDHPARGDGPYSRLLNFASRCGNSETDNTPPSISQKSSLSAEMVLLHEIGDALLSAVQTNDPVNLLDTGKLADFYAGAVGPNLYSRILAQTVKQLTHRNPHLDILEIGAGTGGSTKAIYEEIDNAYSSYTFTDSSPAWFDMAKSWAEPHLHKTVFKTLDISKDVTAQGFRPQSFDVVVAALVLHATPNIEQSLRNIRQVLKPGGHLVVLELLPTQSAVYGLIFGSSPDWWAGIAQNQASSPALDLRTWHSLLQNTGFSGHDSVSRCAEQDNSITHFTVFTSQAMDDKVNFLHQPLTSTLPHVFGPGELVPELIILQGDDPKAKELVEQLEALLHPHYRRVKTVSTLKQLADVEISSQSAVLSLTELFEPVFQGGMDEQDWAGLTQALMTAGTLFWVTWGRRAANPMTNMMIGMLRSVVREVPTLGYQFFDFEDRDSISARSIAEWFVRFQAESTWRRHDNAGASLEPELVLDKTGHIVIPRLKIDVDMNDRYNSFKRAIKKPFHPHQQSLSVVASGDGAGYSIKHQPLLHLENGQSYNTVEVTHALVSALRVTAGGCMFLVCGKEKGSQRSTVALCSSNSSIVRPAEDLSVAVQIKPGSEAELVALVSHHLLVSFLLAGISAGDVILVHASDVDFATTLTREARRIGALAVFVTDTKVDAPSEEVEWLMVPQMITDRELSRRLPGRLAVYVDFASSSTTRIMGDRIRALVPSHCRYESLGSLSAGQAWTPPRSHIGKVSDALRQAVALATSTLLEKPGNSKQRPPVVVTPESLADVNQKLSPFSVINWNASSEVSALVRPIDTHITFKNNKTYWLVGLTGGLGLSLCEWMVRHGAKYFVISSRNPKIDPAWLDGMREAGAVVKISSCDITVREEVAKAHAEICATMPAIIGVAQGAMVLEDRAIRDMTVDNFLRGTRPKVEGSIHLDELFQDNTLDFFIFFSSVVSIVGRPGQANYSAANSFMASLARQRRQKGLASSIIHIGPIFGVGYVAHLDKVIFTKKALQGYALVATSERDFYQLFAEAVVASPAGSSERYLELFNGARRISPHEEGKPAWESDALMSHFVRNPEGVATVASSDSQSRIPLKTQLEEAKDRTQIHDIIQDAFLPKVYSLFQLDSAKVDTTAVAQMRLDEMGIDSLIAVEIRGWFMKTIEVNIPVLKILSGVPIGELIAFAAETIPDRLVPGLKGGAEEGSDSEHDVSTSEDTAHESPGDDQDTSDTPASSASSWAGDEEVEVTKESPPTLVAAEKSQVTLKTARLSPSQEMFWFVWEFLRDKTSLNHTAWARMTGRISIPDFEKALKTVTQRHETLRTRIINPDGRPVQAIMESSNILVESRAIKDEGEVHEAVELLQDHHVYDVSQGQTVRIMLLSRSPDEHYFVSGLHPLVADGSSFQTLIKEVLYFYTFPGAGLTHHARQFSDYSEKQHAAIASGKLDADIKYWSSEFATLPPPLPILKVGKLSSRPPLTTYENERAAIRVPAELKERIQTVCKKCRATPFHFYLAVFRALLLRYAPPGEGKDVAVGIGDANRTEDDMMDVIGPFVNLLPLRLLAESSLSFTDLLQGTRDRAYSALQHSRVPFQLLLNKLNVSRSSEYTSLFQCFVNYRQGLRASTRWGPDNGFELHAVEIGISKMAYDVTLEMVDYADGDCLQTLVVRKDLYGEEEARQLVSSYELLLKAFAADPTMALDQPGLFESEVVERVMKFSQGPSWTSQWPDTVAHRIDEIAQRNPNHVAVHHLGITWTYAEIQREAETIAQALLAADIAHGSPIAVLQDPGPAWVSSFLAILRVGAVYLPLDMNQPWARIAAVVGHSQASVVLVDEDSEKHVLKLNQAGIRAINVSSLDCEISQSVPILASAESPAAILYTSGSTGVPKGIVLKHHGLRNWAEPISQQFGIGEEVVLQQTSPTFDLSLVQILTALCLGGSLVLVPREQRGDAVAITKMIADYSVTFTCATPSEYSNWLHHGNQHLQHPLSWKTVFSAGEPLRAPLVKDFAALDHPGVKLYNLYGPTEASLTATAAMVPLCHSSGPISVGRPLPGYSILVLDDKLRPLGPGVQGEVYIGGAGVASGYLGRPDLTAERFVANHLASPEEQSRGWLTLHRTGDVGRWTADGNLLLEGRTSGDTQIKLRGLRIDLAEVEHALLEVSDGVLHEAVVSVRASSADNSQFLVAHIVVKDSTTEPEGIATTISTRLSARLPRYMCPAMLIVVGSLPKTTSGKLDRRGIEALPLPSSSDDRSSGGEDADKEPLTQTQSRLLQIWKTLLDSPHRIGPETDLFHVGGSSLLLPRLQAQIRKEFGIQMPLIRMFESSTLSAMAHRIDNPDQEAMEVEAIDWDTETALPATLPDLRPIDDQLIQTDSNGPPEVVILTGATGQLGRALLAALASSPSVKHIHCIAVRNPDNTNNMVDPKITYHKGDLTQPLFGLSESTASTIFRDANAIIHNAADMSYLKTFPSLRAANLLSTKDLVEMSARFSLKQSLPAFHYISTISVGNLLNLSPSTSEITDDDKTTPVFFPPSSARHLTPPTRTPASNNLAKTGFGYIASKWASEVFLERAITERYSCVNWEVVIHRPSLIARAVDDGDNNNASGLELAENLRRYGRMMKAVPRVPRKVNVGGAFDQVLLGDVVDGVMGEVLGVSEGGIRYRHHVGGVELPLEDLAAWVGGDDEKMEEVEAVEWADRAGGLGMHETVVAMVKEIAGAETGGLVLPRVVGG
ncbi:hypothetical protein QBC40DRAFT_318825 [Triangularia verruculosa]|uniref:Uncharacterized protein n=1 Tax=Triangularia verruculosa TaxID=2587418 RepID=A0AAN6X895_9PEZI|nr:hypothetical protein QBC40DRAFT_318825 [Triangularia verruculosa]